MFHKLVNVQSCHASSVHFLSCHTSLIHFQSQHTSSAHFQMHHTTFQPCHAPSVHLLGQFPSLPACPGWADPQKSRTMGSQHCHMLVWTSPALSYSTTAAWLTQSLDVTARPTSTANTAWDQSTTHHRSEGYTGVRLEIKTWNRPGGTSTSEADPNQTWSHPSKPTFFSDQLQEDQTHMMSYNVVSHTRRLLPHAYNLQGNH